MSQTFWVVIVILITLCISCDYYNEGPIDIALDKIIGNIGFLDIIQISFELQIHHSCGYLSYCHIFALGDRNPLLLMQNGEFRSIFMSLDWPTRNVHSVNDIYYTIIDGSYHSFYLKYLATETMMVFDGITYIHDTNVTNNNQLQSGTSHDISAVWADTQSIPNGTIRQLCVKSTIATPSPTFNPSDSTMNPSRDPTVAPSYNPTLAPNTKHPTFSPFYRQTYPETSDIALFSSSFVNGSSDENHENEKKKKRDNMTQIVILGGIIVVALLVGVAAYILKKKHGKQAFVANTVKMTHNVTSGAPGTAIGGAQDDAKDEEDEEATDVKEWLQQIGLDIHYDVFIQNGYKSLQLIQHITNENDLHDIGVTFEQHRVTIMSEIDRLNYQTQGERDDTLEYRPKMASNEGQLNVTAGNTNDDGMVDDNPHLGSDGSFVVVGDSDSEQQTCGNTKM